MPMLTRDQYDLLVLALAWAGGFAPMLRRKEWTWLQAVGLGLLLTPFVRMALDFYLTVVVSGVLFHYTVLEPVSAEALWRGVEVRLIDYALLPVAGVLILHNAVPRVASRRAPPTAPADAFARHGVAPRASWPRDAWRGLALFVFIAAAYVAALALSATALAGLSANGDESRYWQNITVPLVLTLSLVAGITEEFLFRGVLLAWLAKRMPWIVAALVQALAFGLVHSGYGTWAHVVGPLAFGFGMAWVARHLGVVVTAILHAGVDVVSLGLTVAPDYVAVHGAWGLATLAGLLLLLVAGSAYALWRTRADAVRILWADLVRLVTLRRRAPDAEESAR